MKRFLASLSIVATVLASPVLAYAAPLGTGSSSSTFAVTTSSAGKNDACLALKEIDPSKTCGTGTNSVGKLISSVVNLLSTIVGIAAVIMIIVSGFKYVTSGGDSGGIASAKTTLIYALVGLAIAALAQVLVRFVLNTAR